MKILTTETGEEIPTLSNGNNSADSVMVLAHGAGAPMDSGFMETVAQGLAAAGHRCVRFEFPYMAKRRDDGKRRPPDRQPKLLDMFRSVLAAIAEESGPNVRLFAGGKSMGGRMATLLAAEKNMPVTLSGVVVLGYPFHPPGKPTALRTGHFSETSVPVLICQGERDSFGTQEEVSRIDLPETIEIAWFPDGNHDLAPRKKSGISAEENVTAAIARTSAFMSR